MCKAFEPKFLGPYKIIKLLGDLNYELEAPNLKTEIVHYNRMQHFHVRDKFCVPQQTAATVSEPVRNLQPVAQSVDPFFLTLLQNPFLRSLKKKTTKTLIISGLIKTNEESLEAEQYINKPEEKLCRALVPYVAPHSDPSLTSVSLGRAELLIPVDVSGVYDPAQILVIQRFNEKGKPVVACPLCGRFYEQKTGLRIHSYYCRETTT